MTDLERLLIDMKESLEREMLDLKVSLRRGFEEINTRFDNQAARLDRQGSLIQIGSRWTTRMNSWAEKVDAALEQKDNEIRELKERMSRLEKNGA